MKKNSKNIIALLLSFGVCALSIYSLLNMPTKENNSVNSISIQGEDHIELIPGDVVLINLIVSPSSSSFSDFSWIASWSDGQDGDVLDYFFIDFPENSKRMARIGAITTWSDEVKVLVTGGGEFTYFYVSCPYVDVTNISLSDNSMVFKTK